MFMIQNSEEHEEKNEVITLREDSGKNPPNTARDNLKIVIALLIILVCFLVVFVVCLVSRLNNANFRISQLTKVGYDVTDEILVSPTMKPFEMLPSASAIPSSATSIGPTVQALKEVSYQLPSGWQTVNDADQQFSLAFDPNLFRAMPHSSRIDLAGPFNFFIRIEPYSGGSRHAFIRSHFGSYESLSSTFEKEYLINGRSALVIYNVEASATTVIGMIVIDKNRGFLISATGGSEQEIVTLLSTAQLK